MGQALRRLHRFLQPKATQADLDNAALLACRSKDAAALREKRRDPFLAIGAV
jgi:hypothetical protein